nr:hypothetical protein PDK3.090 [Rhodococcus sp. DK17]
MCTDTRSHEKQTSVPLLRWAPPVRASAIAAPPCVTIGGRGTARRPRRCAGPARSAPPPIHSRAGADPPIGAAAREHIPMPTRNPTRSATAAHPPTTPCHPFNRTTPH